MSSDSLAIAFRLLSPSGTTADSSSRLLRNRDSPLTTVEAAPRYALLSHVLVRRRGVRNTGSLSLSAGGAVMNDDDDGPPPDPTLCAATAAADEDDEPMATARDDAGADLTTCELEDGDEDEGALPSAAF